jgi:hypothetical protein
MWTCGICLPCLTRVAFPRDAGDERQAQRALRSVAPIVWDEGLDVSVLAALADAAAAGDVDALAALDDVRTRGPRSNVVHTIIWHLAGQMIEDMHARRR